jgi:hypothetical protein
VPGERHERGRLRDVADDADAVEAEAVRDRGARTLQDSTRTELAAREGSGQRVERLELDMRSSV